MGVRERSKTIIVFLTGRIPESQVDGLAIVHYVCRVVIKHSRDIIPRKRVRGVRDEKARLAHAAVADDDAFQVLHFIKASTSFGMVIDGYMMKSLHLYRKYQKEIPRCGERPKQVINSDL